MATPTTPRGLRLYDGMRADEAVITAWITPGAHPEIHALAQRQVRNAMPLLGRALDRAAAHRERASVRDAEGTIRARTGD